MILNHGKFRNASAESLSDSIQLSWPLQAFFFAEKTQNMEVIYDEVKTEEKSWDTHPKTSGQFLQETKENHFGLHHRNLTFSASSLDDKKKPASHGRLVWAAASLGILCLILIFVIASLSISCKSVSFVLQRFLVWEQQQISLSDYSRAGAPNTEHDVNGAEPAAADGEDRLTETDAEPEHRQGQTELDHQCHPGLPKLPCYWTLSTERWGFKPLLWI